MESESDRTDTGNPRVTGGTDVLNPHVWPQRKEKRVRRRRLGESVTPFAPARQAEDQSGLGRGTTELTGSPAGIGEGFGVEESIDRTSTPDGPIRPDPPRPARPSVTRPARPTLPDPS